VGVSLLIGVTFWYLRRRRPRAEVQLPVNKAFLNPQPIPSSVGAPHTAIQPTSSGGHAVHTEAQQARSSDGTARISGAFGLPEPNDSMAIDRHYVRAKL